MSGPRGAYLLLLIFGLPFVLSGAFYFSPWIGWPLVLPLTLVWVGALSEAEQDRAQQDKA